MSQYMKWSKALATTVNKELLVDLVLLWMRNTWASWRCLLYPRKHRTKLVGHCEGGLTGLRIATSPCKIVLLEIEKMTNEQLVFWMQQFIAKVRKKRGKKGALPEKYLTRNNIRTGCKLAALHLRNGKAPQGRYFLATSFQRCQMHPWCRNEGTHLWRCSKQDSN